MKAIILAGGNGSRLKKYHSENAKFPKPMLQIGGVPLLDLIIRQLASHGFDDVVISTGYMAEVIEDYFKDNKNVPEKVKISFSRQEPLLGTAGPLSIIPDLNESFLVINGDLLAELNFSDFWRFHKSHEGILTLATYKQEFATRGNLETNGNLIKKYKEENLELDMSFSIWIAEPSILKYINKNKFLNLDTLINKLIEVGEKIIAYKLGYNILINIDLDEDYEKANEAFLENREKFLIMK